MATFKLGMIITDIAGSVGGTTLKRNGTYKVMMNKSTGTAYSRSLQNQALSYLGSIFKAWTFLSDADKSAWETQALNFTFPDKFGTLRNLTGRQLYIKLNGQNYKIDPTPIDPTTIDSELVPFTIDQCIYVVGLNQFTVSVDSLAVSSRTYMVSVELSLQPLRAPTFVARKVIHTFSGAGSTGTDILADLLLNYPYFDSSYNCRVYLQEINSSGFTSVMQEKTMTLM